MSKKIIFTLIVLAAIIGISYKMNQPQHQKSEITLSNPDEEVQNLLEKLTQKNIKSIVIFASNIQNNIPQADKLVNALKNKPSTKILAFEIYNSNSSSERLIQLGFEKGNPDIFYLNGQLITSDKISNTLKKELETISGAKSIQ